MTKEELLASQRLKCTELGFESDTVHHTNCVLELEKARLARKAAHSAAWSAANHAASQAAGTPAPAPQIIFVE